MTEVLLTTNGPGIGDQAPDFELPTTRGGTLRLGSLRGRKVVLYFYPKADTSGCTAEAVAFQAALPQIEAQGATVIGISKDPVRKLEAFAAKAGLSFPLASDEPGKVVAAYGAWIEKSMYGRSYMGIDRSTFILDAEGLVAAVWHKVKVSGHACEVVASLAGDCASATGRHPTGKHRRSA